MALSFGFAAWLLPDYLTWPLAIVFGVFVGQFACRYFRQVLRYKYMKLKPDHSRGVPPSLVGLIEQLIFVVAVGSFHGEAGVFAVMGLWLGAKMLTGWNRADPAIIWSQSWQERQILQRRQDERARGALSALLTGVLSLAIATVGGNIAAKGAVVIGGNYVIAPIVLNYLAVIQNAVQLMCNFVAE
jgi:hypothetical protein